jgi:hypothetical protein
MDALGEGCAASDRIAGHAVALSIVDAVGSVRIPLRRRSDDPAIRSRTPPAPTIGTAVDFPSIAISVFAACHDVLP